MTHIGYTSFADWCKQQQSCCPSNGNKVFWESFGFGAGYALLSSLPDIISGCLNNPSPLEETPVTPQPEKPEVVNPQPVQTPVAPIQPKAEFPFIPFTSTVNISFITHPVSVGTAFTHGTRASLVLA